MNKTIKIGLCVSALLLFGACGDDDSGDNSDGGSGGKAGSGGKGGSGGSQAGRGGDSGASDPMPRGKANPPELGNQIDRMGRPAISTALISTFADDDAAKGTNKDAYNAAAPDAWSDFEDDMVGSLGILDGLDGTCGNQLLADPDADRYALLASVLADDQLYVNSDSGTCGVYLGVEAEVVGAVPAGDGGCGGRTPLEDVIERSYSVLAAGILTGVDDTITEDDVEHDIDTFPFLAEPQD